MPSFINFLEGISGSILKLSNVPTNSAEEPPPALFIDGDGLVQKRDLGGNAFTNIPSNVVLTTGNQTVAGVKTFSDNVGIGTTTPDSKLEVVGNYKQKAADGNTQGFTLSINSSTDAVSLNNFYNASMTFSTNNSVKMTILGGGNVGVGTTSPSQKLEVVGKAKITTSLAVGAITPSATTGRIDASNDIVAFSTSDIRLKDNIKVIDNALDKVNSIQGIEFDWIKKESVHGNEGHDIGVIAQEIEKILPDVVTTRDNGYKAVKYEKIVPLLIEAIKELTNEINELKNK